eukprot:scaffold10777_cov18-Tisochrysis_lutea.AAC.5
MEFAIVHCFDFCIPVLLDHTWHQIWVTRARPGTVGTSKSVTEYTLHTLGPAKTLPTHACCTADRCVHPRGREGAQNCHEKLDHRLHPHPGGPPAGRQGAEKVTLTLGLTFTSRLTLLPSTWGAHPECPSGAMICSWMRQAMHVAQKHLVAMDLPR